MEREQPLSIVKGDSFSALLSVNYDNGDAYEFKDGDKVFFEIKKKAFNPCNVNALVHKELTINDICEVGGIKYILLSILPDDTNKLSTGTYEYDLRLVSGEDVYTIIPKSDFVLMKHITEVTISGET